jgi:hypothetical protein
MTISQPSHEIYAVDIPEVKDFSAHFKYNFFVTDESVNDSGGVPNQILSRRADNVDSSFIQYATIRAPRFVTFKFTPVKLSDVGRAVSDSDVNNNVFEKRFDDNLIGKNIDKIITEDDFSSNDFVSIHFHDGALDEKLYELVSGSITQHSEGSETDPNTSAYKSANRLSDQVPDYVKLHFLTRAASTPSGNGVNFVFPADSSGGPSSSETRYRNIRNTLDASGRNMSLGINTYFRRLSHVNVSTQINTKLFHDVVDRMIKDPQSMYGNDLHSLYQFSKQAQQSSKQKLSLNINENDYKTIVPFVSLQVQRTASATNKQSAEIVGYLIDKSEITPAGEIINFPPIIIENSRVSMSADFRVKYGTTYSYTMRTIVRFTLPAIDNETGDVATIQILVSSKPSNKIYVKTYERVAPPPPTDLNFTWNYETDRLLIHWTFPPNSQRDIKKFQLFRRKDVDHPFELIKMYDFDDSVIRTPDHEFADPSLVEYLLSPATYFTDDEFLKTSKYIYALTAIDAHGMTSNYSAQFQVWFDPFKNKLMKSLISHTGAPKPYPNLYLQAETFVDTIRVNGPHSKRLKLYFNPEYYQLYDDDNKFVKVLSTLQDGGEYQIQFINLDNQKSQLLNVKIDDQVTATSPLVTPGRGFGTYKNST